MNDLREPCEAGNKYHYMTGNKYHYMTGNKYHYMAVNEYHYMTGNKYHYMAGNEYHYMTSQGMSLANIQKCQFTQTTPNPFVLPHTTSYT